MKNRNMNQVRMGAILSYLNMAIGSLIPMFYTPIMLQLMGQSEFGLYRLSSSVTSYLSLISFGIGSAVVRYFTKYRAEGDKDGEQNIFGLFNIVFAIISFLALLVGVIISLNLGIFYSDSLDSDNQLQRMQILTILLSVNTAVGFLASPYNAVVTSHERFLFVQCVNIITTVVTPIANLVVLFIGYKSIGLVCSSLLLTILVQICYIIYVRKNLHLKPKYNNMPKKLIKEILLFSFWVFLANVVNQLYNSTDTLIIGSVPALATVGVAIYNIGATFSSMMTNISLGMLNVLTPKVNMLVFKNASNTELTDLMIRVGRLQCYMVTLVCSGFIAFGMPFIYIWAGKGYEDAYWVALVTMIPGCVPLIQNIAMNVIVAQNKHRFRSLVYLAIALVNVVGTLLCVEPFGIVGAAVVSGIAYIIGTIFIMNWYYWKKIKLDIPRFWKSVLPLFIGPFIMCIITLLISKFIDFYNVKVLFIGILAYAVIYVLYNWIVIMNQYEKDIFVVPVKKILNKFRKKV